MGKERIKRTPKQNEYFGKGKGGNYFNGSRDPRSQNFIISGGESTELWYFRHLTRLTYYKFEIEPKYFGNESGYHNDFPKIIKSILRNSPNAKVFCVFDFDTIKFDKANQKHYQDFLKSIKDYISNGSVEICVTMPSFEYWFLLHFENYKNLLKTCDDTIKRLKKYIPDYSKNSKQLSNPQWVADLCADGKLGKTIKLSRVNIEKALQDGILDEQSYSYVWKVFDTISVARQMKADKLPVSQIISMTGLSKEEVGNL